MGGSRLIFRGPVESTNIVIFREVFPVQKNHIEMKSRFQQYKIIEDY